MSDGISPSVKQSETWLNEVEATLPKIVAVANGVEDAEYRVAVFERLLDAVLQDARGIGVVRLSSTSPAAPPSPVAPPFGSSTSGPVTNGAGRFEQFLRDYSISRDALVNVLDLESGQVLTRNLGGNKATKQRKLAALHSLINAAKTGSFYVSRDELVKACSDNAAYDTSNFSANMKQFEFNGAVVFTPDENGYKISRPGEAFVADVVKSSLPAQTTLPIQ